ncbi:alpha/beta fold hydrolase [Leifsonia shinshuensis]|uniref:Haloacetate dehalogenase n=1 Tax=Leifsonia shinshuensis TaxID=150026 RepID=A0A853CTW8_9MICO|nr:alpha/beta hydrolase [Leifsonia shinshuensis]NYJ22634.1 haloacetate dehalogenase [Leifsonia shinshuensis]
MFEGFVEEDIDVGDAVIHVRHGGDGPPVVLLHGHPRTGATWHRVAPLLVRRGYRVVVPDLRGYGRSTAPEPRPDHAQASKRAMAEDVVALMRELGHERFLLAGHDRGSYVAFRLAMDHPEAVPAVALLDCIPIVEHLERITPAFATAWYHWFFFAQPDLPERVISADPDAWYGGDPVLMGAENFAERRRAIHDPRVVRAMLEDYRAGLGVDRLAEEADRAAGRRLRMPLLVLWSSRDDLEELFGDPLAIWRDWAVQVSGRPIESGHHLAEEAPVELTDALAGFFEGAGVRGAARP